MIVQGIRWTITLLAVLLTVVALVDIYFELQHWRSVSTRMRRWARRYPYYSAGLIFVLGALLAHLFLNSNA